MKYIFHLFLLLLPIISFGQTTSLLQGVTPGVSSYFDTNLRFPTVDTFHFELSSGQYPPCGGGVDSLQLPSLFYLDGGFPIGLHHSGSFTKQSFRFFNNPAGDLQLDVSGNQLIHANCSNYPNRIRTAEDLPILKKKIHWTDHSLEILYAIPGPDGYQTFNMYHRIWMAGNSFYHRFSYHYSQKPQLNKRDFKGDDSVEIQFHSGGKQLLIIMKFNDDMIWFPFENERLREP